VRFDAGRMPVRTTRLTDVGRMHLRTTRLTACRRTSLYAGRFDNAEHTPSPTLPGEADGGALPLRARRVPCSISPTRLDYEIWPPFTQPGAPSACGGIGFDFTQTSRFHSINLQTDAGSPIHKRMGLPAVALKITITGRSGKYGNA